MPSINKPKHKSRYQPHGDNAIIHTLYNSTTWRKLREGYLMKHPLCEVCLSKDIVTTAQEVHHIKPISYGKSEIEMREIAYNPNNLMSLCTKCHHKIHSNMKND